MMNQISPQTKIAVFRKKEIRKTIHKGEWFFSIIDVISVLTNSRRPRGYWNDLKNKLVNEGYREVSEKIGQLKMEAPDGKMRTTDIANTETLFRIIQAIPSSKAQPFKLWLARVGYERVQEIEDPELAIKRTRALYKAKGYPKDWIERRMRGIAIREELTDEWDKRGARQEKDYAILSMEISKATFGIKPADHKKFKKLKRENLRDHMTDLELIFSMLGEKSTTEITRSKGSREFWGLRSDAVEGGKIAGDARKKLELKTGKRVVSKQNYLQKSRVKKIKSGKQSI